MFIYYIDIRFTVRDRQPLIFIHVYLYPLISLIDTNLLLAQPFTKSMLELTTLIQLEQVHS